MAPTQGLILTLDGAPPTPHTVTGVPGTYRTGVPTPVGDGCRITDERAAKLDADASIPLKLVPLTDPQKAAETATSDVAAAKAGARVAQQGAKGDEREVIADQVASVAAGNTTTTKTKGA